MTTRAPNISRNTPCAPVRVHKVKDGIAIRTTNPLKPPILQLHSDHIKVWLSYSVENHGGTALVHYFDNSRELCLETYNSIGELVNQSIVFRKN